MNENGVYKNGYDDFELISDYIKKNYYKYKEPLSDKEVNNIKREPG